MTGEQTYDDSKHDSRFENIGYLLVIWQSLFIYLKTNQHRYPKAQMGYVGVHPMKNVLYHSDAFRCAS
jgi:hypothetical protein